jgi:outer membrane protein TolC
MTILALELFQSEEEVREDQVSILEEIFSAGEIARQNVDLARTERNKIHLALVVAEGQVTEARAALAAAVGIPLAALQSVDFAWPSIGNPPRAEAFSIEEIKRGTLLNRLDLRRSLAQYAAAVGPYSWRSASNIPT